MGLTFLKLKVARAGTPQSQRQSSSSSTPKRFSQSCPDRFFIDWALVRLLNKCFAAFLDGGRYVSCKWI